MLRTINNKTRTKNVTVWREVVSGYKTNEMFVCLCVRLSVDGSVWPKRRCVAIGYRSSFVQISLSIHEKRVIVYFVFSDCRIMNFQVNYSLVYA